MDSFGSLCAMTGFQFLRKAAAAWLGDRRGNVAIISALMLPVLLGSFGLGTEVATWYGAQRALQNAADSAAIAAATNASATYGTEAAAVAAQYGYVNGQNGVTVTTANNVACPGGGSNCYRVVISKTQPLILAQFVGYAGDTLQGGAPAKRIAATAIAVQGLAPRPYCVVALAGDGVQTGLLANGAPKADLTGCNVMSNTGARCNGHDLGADYGDAAGTNDGCGEVQNSNVPVMPDQNAARASNIPADPCGGVYPEAPGKHSGSPLPASNRLAGVQSWSGVIQKCGDVELTGPVTINTTGPATLVIHNGDLDLNGYTLQTSSGSGLTIVFAGDNSRSHVPLGGGTLDFAAPTSGPWSGVAMYQAPNLTSGVDIAAAGNSPAWNITGMVYLPHSHVTFSGAVNKSSNGASCFVMVVDSMVINGTGSILAHGQCGQAGLTMPTNNVPSRGKLVS